VSSSLLPDTELANVNMVIFHSFLLYIFYKVIVSVKTNFQISLFYLSFIIPILILVILLIRQ
jgi:hypothetical protein